MGEDFLAIFVLPRMKRFIPLRLPGLVAFLLTALPRLYAQEMGASQVPIPADTWVRWIGWVFVIMALGGLLVFWINLRLQGQISLQTRALRASRLPTNHRVMAVLDVLSVRVQGELSAASARWRPTDLVRR